MCDDLKANNIDTWMDERSGVLEMIGTKNAERRIFSWMICMYSLPGSTGSSRRSSSSSQVKRDAVHYWSLLRIASSELISSLR